jgi:hypothetical protein
MNNSVCLNKQQRGSTERDLESAPTISLGATEDETDSAP